MINIEKTPVIGIIASSVFGIFMLTTGGTLAAPVANTVVSGSVLETSVLTQVRHRRRIRRSRSRRHSRRNLFLGLGAGALIGGAIANQNNYYSPPPPRVRYRGGSGYRAWSPGWYRYCRARFRSFNPRTGYYMSYNYGLQFCY
jgi:BA14K-like protein